MLTVALWTLAIMAFLDIAFIWAALVVGKRSEQIATDQAQRGGPTRP